MRRLKAVLTSLRPQQWAKNLLVFAGLIFAQKLFTPLVWPALAAFALFCARSGAVVIDVEISGWLLICTILLGLLLALGKRRYELVALDGGAARHRPVLARYSTGLLDQMIAVVTASTVTAYALYTMSPETVGKFHTQLLPATLPFVLYGIFRYLYLLYRRQLGGNPSELFLNDRALLLNTLLWMLAVLLIIYGHALAARVGV